MLEERLNYHSILFIGKDVIKSSYEEVIKDYAAKKSRKKVYRHVMQLIIENIMLFVVLSAFFKAVISCDF
jgi:hypothetical protein